MRLFIFLTVLLSAGSASASEFRLLGRATLFTNDYLGDGYDRWRSGSYSRSLFFGKSWDGDLSSRKIFEMRLRGELIAPSNTSAPPARGERPFVGIVAFGTARHLRFRKTDIRAGAEIVAIGPQTGIAKFVRNAHRIIGFEAPLATTGQLGNDLIPTANIETARMLRLGNGVGFELRPFVEAQSGAEGFIRTGVDAFFGQGMAGNLITRDVVTGHIMTAVSMKGMAGLTPMIGVDVTRVYNSYYLPRSSGLAFKKWRVRVRGGVRSQGYDRDVFMGLSWLSPEYEGQPQGQVLGSLSVDHRY